MPAPPAVDSRNVEAASSSPGPAGVKKTRPALIFRHRRLNPVAKILQTEQNDIRKVSDPTQHNWAAMLREAQDFYSAGRFEQAEQIFRDLHHVDPNNADICVNLAMISQQLGRAADAETFFRRSLQLDQDSVFARYWYGRFLEQLGRLHDAEAYFRSVLDRKADHADALGSLGDILHGQSRLAEAETAFRRSLTIDPDKPHIHNNLGNLLRTLGRLTEAKECYQTALAINPNYAPALSNFRALEVGDVPLWHLTMLADTARNDAYEQAITAAVTSDTHVLDIGTGSGLLAMIAARAGAERVTACEMNQKLALVAGEIIKANGFEQPINLIDKKSTLLDADKDLPRLADVLVAEVFDVILLGEGALPTLRHAVSNLCTDGAVVIPRSATIKGMLVSLPRLRNVSPVRQISGFDLAAFDELRDPRRNLEVNLRNESYTALSEPFEVIGFDFRKLPTASTEEDPHRLTRKIEIDRKGTLQGVAFWFELDLDENTRVSSGPDGSLRHWNQALQFFDEDRDVTQKDTVELGVFHSDLRIWFTT